MNRTKLHSFYWQGKDENGNLIEGEIQARSSLHVRSLLKKKQISFLTLKKRPLFHFLKNKKIGSPFITQFTRKFYYLIQAGIPLSQSLLLLASSEKNHLLKNIIHNLHQGINAGLSLSMALKQHACFDAIYLGFITCGEETGKLNEILKALIQYREQREALMNNIFRASLYPMLLFFMAILVSIFLLCFVVPSFQELFENANLSLPILTQFIITFSHVVQHSILGFSFLFLLILVILLISYKRFQPFKYQMDFMVLQLPFLGALLLKAYLIHITSVLAMSLASGLAITQSMVNSQRVIKNLFIQNLLKKIQADLNQGQPLSNACLKTTIFPSYCFQLIQIGEQTGQLESTLSHIAKHYTEELNYFANDLTKLLEPLLLVVMSLLIGIVVIAMYLPIFQLGNVIG